MGKVEYNLHQKVHINTSFNSKEHRCMLSLSMKFISSLEGQTGETF